MRKLCKFLESIAVSERGQHAWLALHLLPASGICQRKHGCSVWKSPACGSMAKHVLTGASGSCRKCKSIQHQPVLQALTEWQCHANVILLFGDCSRRARREAGNDSGQEGESDDEEDEEDLDLRDAPDLRDCIIS